MANNPFDESPELVLATLDWMQVTVRGLVDNESAVTIAVGHDTDVGPEIMFSVRVDSRDLGKVIGKEGRLARALRILLRARSVKDNLVYALDIGERTEPKRLKTFVVVPHPDSTTRMRVKEENHGE